MASKKMKFCGKPGILRCRYSKGSPSGSPSSPGKKCIHMTCMPLYQQLVTFQGISVIHIITLNYIKYLIQ